MTGTAFPLGSFTLENVVGAGGSGMVFRARHTRMDLPVAVKVLPPKADRLALHAHKNEIQAVARLHHPHVVALLDAGVVDIGAVNAAGDAGHALVEGSPYLVVELASGGDLYSLRPPFPWGAVSDILRSLLSALAHAHARGVIHKDLKPQNVLLCTDDDVRPGLKLTDFGLAALTGDSKESIIGGTPLFMAPEQFDVDTRDVGPGTDLYALGCLAFWLSSGNPPFVEESWRKLAVRHMEEKAPPLPPNIDAPPGFADWVARLLEKNPAARFRCAADADASLSRLDPDRPPPAIDRLASTAAATMSAGDVDVSGVTLLKPSAPPTEIMRIEPHHVAATADESTDPAKMRARVRGSTSAPDARATVSTTGEMATSQPPPLDVSAAAPPASWRAPAAPQEDLRLVDAGLALWGLRPVPLVGREQERDLLWDALLAAHARNGPRLVVVRGASGVGKSRLAEWITHRAVETGAAIAMKASFQAILQKGDGLTGMVARLCDLSADDRATKERASTWLERWLPGADVNARELCALAGVRDGVFASNEERQSALVRLLVARARERPLLVWLDDAHHGKDALALLARVLADVPELAALFVVTVADELADADARARLTELSASPSASTIELQPLEESAHDELCGKLLGGEAGGLADELRHRTEGNPLFAVHLVGDWVARGLLEVTPQGLTLKPGTGAPELPDALHALWDQRLAGAIVEEEEQYALELAAVLGSNVDLVEWEEAIRAAEIGGEIALDGIVDKLAGVGLARRNEGGFAFAHALVRGSIERRAREARRLAHHHASAATALASLWGTDTPTAAARIGRHLLSAGAAAKALQPLLVAARAAIDEGDVLDAATLLTDWERARAALDLPDTDPRVGPGLVFRAQVAHQEGRHDEARDLARRAAKVIKDPKKRAEAMRAQASACIDLGLLDEAAHVYDDARSTSAAVDDQLGVGQALRGLGDVAYFRGDREAAAARYTAVSSLFQQTGKKSDLVATLWSLGYVEMERGEHAEAKRLFLEQRKISRANRDRLGEANAENALGELARKMGELDEAEQHYRVAARIASRSGLSRRWTFRLNLAHVRVARGDIANARVLATELLASNARNEPIVAGSAWWILACDAATRGDLAAYDKAADEAISVAESAGVELDMANAAQRAGDLIAQYDRKAAEKAWKFAAAKMKALGK